MHQQHYLPAERQREKRDHQGKHGIVDPDAGPFFPARSWQVERQAMFEDELVHRTEAQQHRHAAIEAIAQALPPG